MRAQHSVQEISKRMLLLHCQRSKTIFFHHLVHVLMFEMIIKRMLVNKNSNNA